MESFFSLLQKNVLDTRRGRTREELRLAIVLDRDQISPQTQATTLAPIIEEHIGGRTDQEQPVLAYARLFVRPNVFVFHCADAYREGGGALSTGPPVTTHTRGERPPPSPPHSPPAALAAGSSTSQTASSSRSPHNSAGHRPIAADCTASSRVSNRSAPVEPARWSLMRLGHGTTAASAMDESTAAGTSPNQPPAPPSKPGNPQETSPPR